MTMTRFYDVERRDVCDKCGEEKEEYFEAVYHIGDPKDHPMRWCQKCMGEEEWIA